MSGTLDSMSYDLVIAKAARLLRRAATASDTPDGLRQPLIEAALQLTELKETPSGKVKAKGPQPGAAPRGSKSSGKAKSAKVASAPDLE